VQNSFREVTKLSMNDKVPQVGVINMLRTVDPHLICPREAVNERFL